MYIRSRFLFVFITVILILASISVFIFIKNRDRVKEIQFEALPHKTEYYVGEDLNLNGLLVRAYKKNKKSFMLDINSLEFSGFENDSEGIKTITVAYQGFEIQFNVKVVNLLGETPYLVEISIDKEPTKKVYKVGESINLSGGTIKLIYSNGSIKKLSLIRDYIVEFDSSVAIEEYIVNISYRDPITNGTFTTYFIVKIEE